MRRLFFLGISFLFLIFLISPVPLFAQSEFETDITVTYDIDAQGGGRVNHFVTLTNTLSNIYAVSYTLNLQGLKPTNIQAYTGGTPLAVSQTQEDDHIAVKIEFSDPIVGKGNQRNFNIVFTDTSLAHKEGEVWEVSVPRLSNADSFNSYTAILNVPVAFGEKAYVSPSPSKEEVKGNIRSLVFKKQTISEKGVVAAFGPFQVFSFDLTYHLENPLSKSALTQIALPPDTSFQKVYYSSLSPLPEKVEKDNDGNWLAFYKLKSRERVDVKALGTAQLFSQPTILIPTAQTSLVANLKESEVWQINDPVIENLAQQIKTPRAIYDYLVANFKYDYDRVKPNAGRLGAKEALLNPQKAICTEFTDAFIALARAAGIPAREVNGFAYTENPDIQPLSLVADVLHAWPEYWDFQKKIWIPIDPTWGNTTGGLDYFSKLDLRHFTFVIHGEDSIKPFPPGSYKLGANPQKDVFVSFGTLPEKRKSDVEIEAQEARRLPFIPLKLNVLVKNPGPSAIYNEELKVLVNGDLLFSSPIPELPPFAQTSIPVTIPYKIIGSGLPKELVLVLGETRVVKTTPKRIIIITNLAFVLVTTFLIATGAYFFYTNVKIRIFQKTG
jgi:transglutaminase-like putative cysteine protease